MLHVERTALIVHVLNKFLKTFTLIWKANDVIHVHVPKSENDTHFDIFWGVATS